MTIERLLVGALATWRITSLLLKEAGPFNVFIHWRTFIARFAGLSALGVCAWCLSIWVAVGATLLALTDAWLVLIPFAFSAVTIGLELIHSRRPTPLPELPDITALSEKEAYRQIDMSDSLLDLKIWFYEESWTKTPRQGVLDAILSRVMIRAYKHG